MAVGARRAAGSAVRPRPASEQELRTRARLEFLLEESMPPRARRAATAVPPSLRPPDQEPAPDGGETMEGGEVAEDGAVAGDGEGEQADDRPGAVTPVGSPVDRAKDFLAGHVLVVAVVVGLAIAVALFWALRARPVALAAPSTTPQVSVVAGPTATASPTPTPVPTILVHVLGAVRRPGVVRLPQGARVQDAIEKAGGLTERARPGSLNLAQVLVDGQQVRIGSTSDPTSTVRGGGGGGTAPGGAGTVGAQRLDLNAATQAQLEELPGVGPVTARSILDWRRRHGRFTRIEQLQEVDGIGPKTFARLEPYVRV